MSRELVVHRAGPALTLQDAGRPGWITQGLSRGGAMDRAKVYDSMKLFAQEVIPATAQLVAAPA